MQVREQSQEASNRDTGFVGVTQERTGWGVGQCTEATIATLMGVSLADVPDLCAGVDLDDMRSAPRGSDPRPRAAFDALLAWLWDQGRVWVEFRGTPDPAADVCVPLANGPGIATSAAESLEIERLGLHAMFGPNPDGIGHSVVGRDGVVVWDPNPSRAGITAMDGILALASRSVLELLDDGGHDFRQGVAYVWRGAS